MRNILDTILQVGIKLCLLTGVAFTFAACYGPPYRDRWENEPDYEKAQEKLEQQLHAYSSQNSTVAGESATEEP